MAYAAVVTLEQILKQLLQSEQFPLQFLEPELESFYQKVLSLQLSLIKIYPVRKGRRDDVNDLETQIRDAIYKAQDTIEAFISKQILPLEIDENQFYTNFLQDLRKMVADVHPIAEKAKEIAGTVQDDHKKGDLLHGGDLKTSRSGRISRSTKIVGQDEDWKKIKDELLKETAERQVIHITGLPGIGKTTLARSIFEDTRIVNEFSIRSWVTVGEEYLMGEIYLKLLGAIESMGQRSDDSGTIDKLSDKVNRGSAEQLALQLYQRLLNTRYLIVMDDIWDIFVWDEIKNYLPNNMSGSRIILTTRNEMVARKVKSALSHEMQRLDQETSWRLLREKVFGGGYCLTQFKTMGREIAKHCHGLPLSITVVGGQLSQERENEKYWKIVEQDIKAAASEKEPFMEILSRSYDQLPGRLKGCFLYMGAFPEDSEIFVSKLIKLWIAEGFLTPPETHSCMEQVAEQYLNELVDRNLIFVRKYSSDGKIRTCGMHDSIRYLAATKSQVESFFHCIRTSTKQKNQSRNRELHKEGSDSQRGKDTDQRRIAVHKNMLMCMKDVYKSTKSIKFARTLLYAGPFHHRPLPSCLTFDFLRVLDALTVYFIDFPNELVKLIHLRYLSFTYNGKLPSSISRLQNLLILIVRRHPKIIIMGNSILPEEIWSMPHLRHVLITESDFPNLPKICSQNSILLKNLQSLSDINADACSKEVLQNMPNLKKLGLWIIEAPDEVEFYLDQLKHLEVFKFTVLNPIPGERIVIQPKLFFPRKLRKLSLSGCGLPWEDMTIVGQLPCLQVLKLREFAFEGPEWCPIEKEFENLKFLLLESLSLKVWQADHFHFPSLECLIIKQCYELDVMNPDIGTIGTLKLIEVVGCSRCAEEWAQEIREDSVDYGNKKLQVRIYSSWE